MTKVLVPLLAVVTLVTVGFVLVELHASHPVDTMPSTPPPAPTPPPLPTMPPPRIATPAPPPPPPPAAAPAPAPPTDPLDVVVQGKTRREWHEVFAKRQQEIEADLAKNQAIVDRAIAGEEPDPQDLIHAHDNIRALNKRLEEDHQALQAIDGTP